MGRAINDGGQAFPRAGFGFTYKDGSTECETSQDGMSLRDYFAAAALTGLISTQTPLDADAHLWAESAYVLADAMLLERQKGQVKNA